MIRKGYVDTSNGQIHFRSAGDVGPFVFLLHQTPLSSRQFERCLPILGKRVRAYAFDTPGYGNSDPPPNPVPASAYATTLLEAIDQITSGPFALCGLLTGSVVALEVYKRAPARVSHLVLAGTPLDIRAHTSDTTPKADGSHILYLWNHRLEVWGKDIEPALAQHATVDVMTAFERYHWGSTAAAMADVRGLLKQVRCPALFVSGERDGLGQQTAEAAAAVPGARHVVIAPSREPLAMTAAAPLSEMIADFATGREVAAKA